jgi:hypothetical protein
MATCKIARAEDSGLLETATSELNGGSYTGAAGRKMVEKILAAWSSVWNSSG